MINLFLHAAAERELVTAIASPLLTIFFGYHLAKNLLLIFRCHRYRREVTGHVKTIERRENRHSVRESIVAEYTVDNRTYTIRSAYLYPYSYYRTGDAIPLRVSEKDPERAVMPYDLQNSKKFALVFGALFFLCLLCTILIF